MKMTEPTGEMTAEERADKEERDRMARDVFERSMDDSVTESRPAFAVGDVVRLKSGGLPMTVFHPAPPADIYPNVSVEQVLVMWHDVNGEPQEEWYHVAMLEPMAIERQGQQPLSDPMNSSMTAMGERYEADWRKSRGLA